MRDRLKKNLIGRISRSNMIMLMQKFKDNTLNIVMREG